jgi:hypothetical protein
MADEDLPLKGDGKPIELCRPLGDAVAESRRKSAGDGGGVIAQAAGARLDSK